VRHFRYGQEFRLVRLFFRHGRKLEFGFDVSAQQFRFVGRLWRRLQFQQPLRAEQSGQHWRVNSAVRRSFCGPRRFRLTDRRRRQPINRFARNLP